MISIKQIDINLYFKYNKDMKTKIIEILSKQNNAYISGEDICKQLNVTRAAVWKNIKKLQEEGYLIESSTKKGYALTSAYDPYDANYLQKNIHCFYKQLKIVDTIDSTNDEMRRNASTHQEGDILIADTQSAGKGRLGRMFHSPKHNGVYVSIFLKPTFPIHKLLKITACTSCAVYDAIKKLYGIESAIKWVNDIYINDKKIAGILCEASLEMNTASLEYMIIGIGINVHTYQMPKPLSDKATSIESHSEQIISRNQILSEVLQRFYFYYRTMEENTFLDTYKKNSYILNKTIDVYAQGKKYTALALDIDEDANLIIQKEDGTKEILNSGEISIRKQ